MMREHHAIQRAAEQGGLGEQRTFPDEVIEHWALVYQFHPVLRERGILFETFLYYPLQCLAAVVFREEHLPLLPAQERVRIRIEAREHYASLQEKLVGDEAHRRGDRYVEPLKHATLHKRSQKGHFRPLVQG